jgi:hypothetical protein
MKFKFLKTTVVSLVFSASCLISAANAGIITWGSPTDIVTATDVSINGTLVEAVNGTRNTDADVTVNGVTFEASNFLGDTQVADFCSTCTTDTNYNTLLSSFTRALSTATVPLSIGGGSLLLGNLYEIQIWWIDDRPAGPGSMLFQDLSGGSSVQVEDKFVIGTFTADTASQLISVDHISRAKVHLNAYQVRDITAQVPEPSTLAIFALGMIGLASRQFKK